MSLFKKLSTVAIISLLGLFFLAPSTFADETLVSNTTPTITTILTLSFLTAGTPTTAAGRFKDADLGDVHAAIWDWGDGTVTTGTVSEPGTPTALGLVANNHIYVTPGNYTLTLTVTDNAGATVQKTRLVVIH